jgi:predicted NAD/FAD-binding protein
MSVLQVIFACHPDQALSLLGESASDDVRSLLSPFKYAQNRVVLHSDERYVTQGQKEDTEARGDTTRRLYMDSRRSGSTSFFSPRSHLTSPSPPFRPFVSPSLLSFPLLSLVSCSLMPKDRGAWASWNYLGSSADLSESEGQAKPVFVTYWINKLQNLDTHKQVGQQG